MANLSGEDVAVLLLRALPSDAAEQILGRLDIDVAERLRARLRTEVTPPEPAELDAALTEFFDLQRIAERMPPPAGEYRPVASPPPAEPTDPLEGLRRLPTDRLTRALEGEPPAAVALILSALDTTVAGQVLKGLSPDLRADVGLRLTQPGARNHALLVRLAQAVLEKAARLADIPREPTPDERILKLADMLRALPRPERIPVLARIEGVDPQLAVLVRDKLYRFEDLLRVTDRQLQGLLAELELKTIAMALKGAEEALRSKITANMSARSRAVLEEELELLGVVPASQIREAQANILAQLRRYEEEGKIVIED